MDTIKSTTSVWDISHAKKNYTIRSQKCNGLHVKYPLFLSDYNKTWIFFGRFPKNAQTWNYMKICPVGAELFHADGRTDTTKLIVAFRNFAIAPKKEDKRYQEWVGDYNSGNVARWQAPTITVCRKIYSHYLQQYFWLFGKLVGKALRNTKQRYT
jgi:hypothetical protein